MERPMYANHHHLCCSQFQMVSRLSVTQFWNENKLLHYETHWAVLLRLRFLAFVVQKSTGKLVCQFMLNIYRILHTCICFQGLTFRQRNKSKEIKEIVYFKQKSDLFVILFFLKKKCLHVEIKYFSSFVRNLCVQ